MAINLDDRYPGRANGKTLSYPQGSFRNRTSPTSKDGTYLEQDWANDWAAFFQSLIKDAGLTASGVVDTAQASQYFDALMLAVANRFTPTKTFAQITALASDQGPIICSDMGGKLYTWQTSAYFTGYRSVCTGEIPNTFLANPLPWMQSMIGGTWNTADPKQARLIAWFQEQGLTIAQASWAPGMGMIADLGAGNWQAPDARDMFWRVSGTDADTANPRGVGTHQGDAIRNITARNATIFQGGGTISTSGAFTVDPPGQPAGVVPTGSPANLVTGFDASLVVPTGGDNRPMNVAVSPIILI